LVVELLPFSTLEVSVKIPKKVPQNGYLANPLTIGEHIRKARIDRNLFQEAVAALFPISESALSKWENNKAVPSKAHMPCVISFLGFDPLSINH